MQVRSKLRGKLTSLEWAQSRVQYMETRMKFREKELSIKEAEDEEKRQAAEAEAAKAAAAEAAAREAAEAQAQAMVEGDGAPEQAPAEEEAAAGSKLSKEQEAAEGMPTALHSKAPHIHSRILVQALRHYDCFGSALVRKNVRRVGSNRDAAKELGQWRVLMQ